MASFTIERKRIPGQISDLTDIHYRLNRVQSQIQQASQTLSLHGSHGDRIRQDLRTQASRVAEHSQKVKDLAGALSDIVSAYDRLENTFYAFMILPPPALELPSGEGRASVFSGSVSGETAAFGMAAKGSLSGDVFGVSYDVKQGVNAKWEKKNGKYQFDELNVEASMSGEAHVAQGSIEGSIGALSASALGVAGQVSAKGGVGASLYKDGKLSPQLYAQLEADAVALQGDADVKFGNDEHNLHGKAHGEIGSASAKVEGQLGQITYEDEHGNEKTTFGAKGEIGAEAYAAKGELSGGFNLFGVQVDVGVSGYAGGVGASAGGQIGVGGVKGKLSAGLGVGGGLDISVDWSNFSFFQ